MNTASQRIGILDSFRGIAALCVILFHYTTVFRINYSHSFPKSLDFDCGRYGVLFFFIISGFVIFLTVEKCKDVNEFIYRRFTRLYPTFWVCLIFTILFLKFFGNEVHFTAYQILINFSMVPKLFHVDPVDGAYWSLVPELVFYAVISIAIAAKFVNKVYFWGGIWLTLSILNSVLQLHLSDVLFRYTGLFLSGIFFYLMFKGDKKIVNHIFIFICYLSTLISLREEPGNLLHVYITITIIYIVFYLFIFNKINFVDIKLLRFLGFISYPLYLIHQNIGYSILLAMRGYGYTGYWTIFVPILFCIFVAFIITQYIEKPILFYARNSMNRVLSISRVNVFNKSISKD